ncbi:MAG: glycosyltransferase family 4 protein [Actinomycetota bacterium]
MRILVFSWKDLRHPWAGGSEVNLHEQARRWLESGHQVTMFTSRPRGSRFRDDIDGVKVYRAGWRVGTFLFAPLAYLLFLRRRCDVVLDIINGIPFCSPLFCRKPAAALMHHVHRDMFIPELGPVLGRVGIAIERYLIPLVYMRVPFICVSGSTRDSIARLLWRGSSMDIRVVYNGIDHGTFTPGDSVKFPEPTVLYLGRLKHYKKVPRLIGLMPLVREKVPDAELIIAGDGEDAPAIEEQVARMDAGGFVRLLGYVGRDEKVRLYRQAWVTATSSGTEGWGLTVIEANACGTPAVAFDVPGLNESIEDGVTGLLASDDREFVEGLVKILSDRELRERMSANAVEWAGRFSWEEAARRTLEILEEAGC